MEQVPTRKDQVVDEASQKDYYQQQDEAIRRGEPVFKQRNFEADPGRVLDYFVDGKYIGHIEEEYGYGCDVYVDGLPERLNLEPTTLNEAKIILEHFGLEK